jgi:hypothetical protein
LYLPPGSGSVFICTVLDPDPDVDPDPSIIQQKQLVCTVTHMIVEIKFLNDINMDPKLFAKMFYLVEL